MGTYTWTGTGFANIDFVASGFFTDPTFDVVFYEQNRNQFFQVTISGGTPVAYAGQAPVVVPKNTVLTLSDGLSQYVTQYSQAISQTAFQNYSSSGSNVLDAYSQSVGQLVDLATEQGLADATSIVTDPSMNYAINEVANSWNNGQQQLQSLYKAVSNLQQQLGQAQKQIQSVIDFKTKLFDYQITAANEQRKIQGQVDDWMQKNTFTALASAFPGTIGTLVQSLQNSNGSLTSVIANLMPSGTSKESQVISNILNHLFPKSIPQIVNPIDKIEADLVRLTNVATQGPNALINQGFADLQSHLNFIDQAMSVLDNAIGKIELSTQTVPKPSSMTPQQIAQSLGFFQSAVQQAEATLNQQVQSAMASQQASWIQDYVSQNPIQLASFNTPSSASFDPKDPFKGGSFFSLTETVSAKFVFDNLPIKPPDLIQSTDATIQQNQVNRSIQQNTSSNAATTNRQLQRGDGVNLLTDIPLKPRNMPLDGSLGGFTSSQNYEL